jgi:hypothetical protein
MKIRENFTQQMNKMKKEVQDYQERWQQTGQFSHDTFDT